MKLVSGMIEDIAFDGEACTICMASASMLCEQAVGQPADRLRSRHESLRTALHDQAELADDDPLAPLLGVRPYPNTWRTTPGKPPGTLSPPPGTPKRPLTINKCGRVS